VRIALVQQRATPEREANVVRGLAAVRAAAARGAQLVAFAELAFDPFHPRCRCAGDRLQLAEPIPGPTTERFAALARELGLVVVLNLYERAGERAFDASPVLDADGSLLGVTRMLHVTQYEGFFEQDYYDPGDRGLPVYATAAGRVGVAICYDRHFPEAMRALALGGAELVVVPQAGTVGEWPEGLYEAELRVASFQNGYYAALANRVGEEETLAFAGESFVCAPDGTVVARGGRGTEQIVVADLDLAACASSHARTLFLRDRRPELYRRWFGREEVAR
jgi:N-carbamoylputrescine amidase